jgi:hypothetical protein
LAGEQKDSHSKIVVAPILIREVVETIHPVGYVQLRGAAAPHSTVEVTIDKTITNTVQASKYGAWVLDARIESVGEHLVSVQNLDEAGKPNSAIRQYELQIAAEPESLPMTGASASGGVVNLLIISLLMIAGLIALDRSKLTAKR